MFFALCWRFMHVNLPHSKSTWGGIVKRKIQASDNVISSFHSFFQNVSKEVLWSKQDQIVAGGIASGVYPWLLTCFNIATCFIASLVNTIPVDFIIFSFQFHRTHQFYWCLFWILKNRFAINALCKFCLQVLESTTMWKKCIKCLQLLSLYSSRSTFTL